MRTPIGSIAALAFGALAACSPATSNVAGTTRITAAELPAPTPREDVNVVHAAKPAEGQLTCRTKDAFGVVTELYVDGDKGVLRRVTPSGNDEEQRLQITHHGDVLLGDQPGSEDLAVHAVTFRRSEGKTFLRLGDWNQSWSTCE